MAHEDHDRSGHDQDHQHGGGGGMYLRFAAMIATSTVVMYILMYLNSWSLEHVFFSQTRMWMALYMGMAMAIVMLAYMLGMYRNRKLNGAIFGGAAVFFGIFLWLVRSQETVGDVAWMKAMIPHHSIAIMTSERANLSDPRAQKLADEIIAAQNREISEMRWLIERLENGETVDDPALGHEPGPPQVASLIDALARPVVATLDLEPMDSAQITQVVGEAPCTFSRSVTAEPVLAVGREGQGVTAISGQLVELSATTPPSPEGTVAETDNLVITVTPEDDDEATLVFELDTEPALTVGYDGYWSCGAD
ncbi:DUF305 domain-containing protein [Citreimonas sp.]|uniref:DUF305 domain-containing protein n=1 Tax=Citreimonas sp. TaxID=3036715 RepID=UPI004057F419